MSNEEKKIPFTACLDNIIAGLLKIKERAAELGVDTTEMTIAAIHIDAAGIEHLYAVDYIAATLEQCYLRLVPVDPALRAAANALAKIAKAPEEVTKTDASGSVSDTVADKRRLN